MTLNPKRPGYAMLLVLVFLILMFSLLALAYGQLGSALRTDAVRSQQVLRDEGSLAAVARGLALLETGFPPTNPYTCGVTINTVSAGARSFTVTFASAGGNDWSVNSAHSAADDNPPPMPATFAP